MGIGCYLVWACDLRVMSSLHECTRRWDGEKRSVVDYILVSGEVNLHRMVIENEGAMELGSDHNLIWCLVRQSKKRK